LERARERGEKLSHYRNNLTNYRHKLCFSKVRGKNLFHKPDTSTYTQEEREENLLRLFMGSP
jgi:hypothetical protein